MDKKKTADIGFGVTSDAEPCNDQKCPFHGKASVRGRVFVGKVIASKVPRTAKVEWERRHLIKKYERYEKRRTRLTVHNPLCINAKDNDIVQLMECRPLSKTKRHIIVKILQRAEQTK